MKNFKRILSMLLLLSMVLSMLPAVSLTASAASTVTMSFADGSGASQETLTFTESGITAVLDKNGHSSAPYHATDHVRFYGTTNTTNTMTISAPAGYNITSIVFTVTGTSYNTAGLTGDSGTVADDAWTGSANTIVFTTTKQARIKEAAITYSASGGSGSGSGDSGTTTDGNTFTLVTSASSLATGDEIVIVAKDYDYALSTTQNSNNRAQAAVTKDGSTVTVGSDTQVLTLTAGTVSGSFGLYTGSGYLYASSSSGNQLKTQETQNDNGSWAISIASDGTATIVAQGTNSRNTMQYNSGSSLFACYASASQKAIAIYKRGGGGGSVTPTSYAVSWTTSGEGSGSVSSTSGASGATVTSGTSVTMTITPASGSTVESVTVNGTAQSVAASGGSITFTVSSATTVAIVWGKEAAVIGDVESGNYVIAAKVGDVYYAMGYEMSTSNANKLVSKEITVTDGTVNPADAIGYIYSIESTDSGYTIFNGETYLAAVSNTSTNVKVSEDPFYWNFSAGTKGSYRVVPVDYSSRTLSFRAATASTDYYVFGAFASSNISASGTQYYDLELIPVSIAPGGSVDTFVKVEDTASLGKGYYLIVNESESMIFDASLEALDVANNYQVVTIANKTIVTSLDYAFAVDVSAGLDQATIKSSKGYYIGRPETSNGLSASTSTTHTNSLEIDENDNAVITSTGGRILLFNTTSGQDRFRYFLSTNTTYPRISLYKCTTSVPGSAQVAVSWTETGAAEDETGGTVTVTKPNGSSITNGGNADSDSTLTLTVTPAEGYKVASVKINGQNYEISEAGGEIEFIITDSTVIEITWEEIVLTPVDVDLQIISGAGKIEVYRDGTKIGSFEGKGGESGKLDQTVYVDDVVKLAIYPGEAQRLVSVENGGRRVNMENLTWDATLGAYTCEIVINGSSEAISFSFLPRKTDIGVVAVLATEFVPGKYVITGTTFDPTAGNSFDTKETYLLFGCDDLLASGVTTIGRKAAALNLYEAGITIQTSSPYTMEGLTKGSLYDIQPYGDTGYYTMQVCGMTDTYYLAARNENELRVVKTEEINDYALWSISIDSNGIATILNKSTGRILKFNAAADNNQFRAYKTTLAGAYYQPVLYKATVTGYQVSYSKTGLGTVTVYNSTTSTSVASGSIQQENSVIVLAFTPAQYNNLVSVTINGVDYTSQVANGRLTLDPLAENLDIKVVFSNIVISNNVIINYYVNKAHRDTIELENLSVFSIVPDLSHTVVIGDKTYKYSELTFEYSENATTGAMYSNPNDAIKINDGDVINLYFLTSAIKLNKTAVQTTQTATGETNFGGDDSESNFTEPNNDNDAANNGDENGNVKQTYQLTLEASSSNWAETFTTGGRTDIIVILDNSLSMYDATEDGTNTSIINKDVLLNALNQFLTTVFVDSEADNRVALITYHTTAYLHNSSNTGGYRKTENLPSSFTYSNTFMTNKTTIYNLAKNAMSSESAVDAALSNDGGTTNPEAALKLAKQVAALRTGEDAARDIIVIMFTDGKPTSRLTNEYTYTFDSTGDGTRWSGGNETSSREYNETLSAGLALKKYFNESGCKSTIYSVALLNALESSSNISKYYTMVGYLYGAGTNARQWVGSQDNDIVANVSTSSNWKKVTGFSDVYKPIYTNKVDVQTELSSLFESIAYTAVPGHYVTIYGSVVDVIPPQFALTEESKEALEDAGWTITYGSNGTTISHSNFPATYEKADNHDEVSKITYEIECVGGGYGAVFTNTYATFTYTDIQTDSSVSANFYKPTVEIIPWTVDDHAVAQLKTDLVIDIIGNDLFSEYTAGGYTLENYTVTLTDANGNPATYMNAVEQNGDPSTYFDAYFDPSNGTVTFYTETNGSYEFYYVVQATIVKPDGSKEVVYSRVTAVDVVTPNVNLTKTAQEVTENSSYKSYVTTDDYGNEQQLYLITLKVEKKEKTDKIYNGVLTDKIPENFEFVKFVSPASNANLNYENRTITWTNISETSTSTDVVTLQFLLRYTGDGYGTAPTNTSANFTYNFGESNGPETTQYFPVPTAGLKPDTVNDLDIAHSGDTNTLDVLTNDLFDEDGFQLPNYPVGGTTVIITDENGNPLADPEAYYGMEITVNEDGTITYTAPETGGPVQFYYVVEATVTLPLDSTYAQDNSTTLVSRPTMVTVYTITDKYLVVDFGYKTDGLSLLPDSGVVIATEYDEEGTRKEVKLSECITFSTPMTNGAYGTAEYTTAADDVTFAFTPDTMDFYATDHFETSLSTTKNTYVSVEREIASGVTVIPANNLFFEEGFINYGVYIPSEDDGKVNEKTGTWTGGAWVTEGETDTDRTQSTANIIYGYDEAYKAGEVYSGGSTKAVTVKPTLEENGDKYGDEHGYFTFTGTGFDIHATCSRDTGVLIAEIYAYDEEMEYSLGKLMRVVFIDTYFDGGEGVVFDQLPVIMCHDLPYGHYTVKLRAYYHAMFDHNYVKPNAKAVRKLLNLGYDVPLEIQTLDTANAKPSTRALPNAANGQYNVYVDSVRIYNPITEVPTEAIAYKAYAEAGEINSYFTNIRDHLLDADDWTAGQDVVNGFLYIADQRAEELIPDGDESGATTDQNGQAAPETTGTYLSPTGELKTEVENGKTYLLNQNDVKATYEGYPIYIVYNTVRYVAEDGFVADSTGYRYTLNSTEYTLSSAKLADSLLKRNVEDGKTYMLNAEGEKVCYNDIPVYEVYIKETADGEKISYVAEDGVEYDRVERRYPDYEGVWMSLSDEKAAELIRSAFVTSVEDGKTYLYHRAVDKITYAEWPVYLVYIKETADGEEISYVAEDGVEYDRIEYRYTDADIGEQTLSVDEVAEFIVSWEDGKYCLMDAQANLINYNGGYVYKVYVKETADGEEISHLPEAGVEYDRIGYYYIEYIEREQTLSGAQWNTLLVSTLPVFATLVENEKTYLVDANEAKITYKGCAVYLVYYKTEYLKADSVRVESISYRYTDGNGVEQVLSASKLKELNIVHYVSRYEAFGPKYEVHLQNGSGIAFKIPNQAGAQISAKMADNGEAQIYAYYTKDGKLDWYPVASVSSRTEMYYDLTACIEDGMLIVKCVTDDENAILSLCNLKTSGESGDVAPAMDGKGLIRAAFAFAGKGDALEETETVLDENITIGQQLSLGSDLTMSFRIKEALLSGYDMNTAYLTVERDIYPSGGAKQMETLTITEFKLEDGVMSFFCDGISAAQMNDEMRVVLHIEDAMGNAYESPVLTTSITLYAKNLLEQLGAENAALSTLVMDMLNYGAAAQRYFDRHADAPANEAYPIFADFAAYATPETAALENLFTEIENEGTSAKLGIALELASRVGILYSVSLPEGVAASEAVLNITDGEGKLLESISLADATVDSKGRYVVCYNGSVARQMRDVVYATLTVDGEAISNTYGYSISTYAAQVASAGGSLAELTGLMVAYGDAAKAYFG